MYMKANVNCDQTVNNAIDVTVLLGIDNEGEHQRAVERAAQTDILFPSPSAAKAQIEARQLRQRP